MRSSTGYTWSASARSQRARSRSDGARLPDSGHSSAIVLEKPRNGMVPRRRTESRLVAMGWPLHPSAGRNRSCCRHSWSGSPVESFVALNTRRSPSPPITQLMHALSLRGLTGVGRRYQVDGEQRKLALMQLRIPPSRARFVQSSETMGTPGISAVSRLSAFRSCSVPKAGTITTFSVNRKLA